MTHHKVDIIVLQQICSLITIFCPNSTARSTHRATVSHMCRVLSTLQHTTHPRHDNTTVPVRFMSH